MPFFSRVFGRNKDGASNTSKNKSKPQQNGGPSPMARPQLPPEDPWSRKEVSAEEVQDLLRYSSQEMKSRDLDMPFLILPFRPNADTSAARNFIRSFFNPAWENSGHYQGAALQHELRLLEPMVLCSVTKWCWSRLRGGVIGWNTYNLFQTGEKESNMAKHAFDTFIPLSVESEARKNIIFDFFDLLAAIAANAKMNGLGGRKLSRLAGWWAFEHSDTGKGFDGGYKSWASAANATSHLFFAYLRFLAPDVAAGSGGISQLPRSLQALLADTEYPPEAPSLHHTLTSRVVMIVENVSPTPYSLLRRAKNFEYRDEDSTLQRFSEYDDPIQALTFECRRVLDCISSTNQSATTKPSIAAVPSADTSWSRFEDLGFTSLLDGGSAANGGNSREQRTFEGLRSQPSSGQTDFARPTTPSWADFLSSGFPDDSARRGPGPLLLPTQQILPPIGPARVHSSQSHVRNGMEDDLEPGELASINRVDLDETFWWVWITSLAAEEPPARKAVFGRCAFVETEIFGGQWLVMEEQVKGAAAQPDEGAYLVEKKRRFGFTKRSRERRSSTGRKNQNKNAGAKAASSPALANPAVNPDQHAKVQEAARDLIRRQNADNEAAQSAVRRGRASESAESKANSVMTLGLQPTLKREAAPALEWSRKFDKDTIRARYLGDPEAGTGVQRAPSVASTMDLISAMKAVDNPQRNDFIERDLPPTPTNRQEPLSSEDTLNAIDPPSQPPPPPPPPPPPSEPIVGDSLPSPNHHHALTAPSHRHKESEKTVVPTEALNHTTRKPVGSIDSTPGDHPAFRQSDDREAYDNEPVNPYAQKTPPPPTTATPAAAAAAAAMKNSNSSQTGLSPGIQKSKVGSTKKIRSLFSRKRPEDKSGDEPEALAMHRAINAPNQNGRVGQKATLRKPAPPIASPPPVPYGTGSQNMPADPQSDGRDLNDLDEGEPGPEMETLHNMHDAPTGHSLEYRMHPNQSSAQFSNFTQGPLEDQPAFDPDEPVPALPNRRRSSVSRPSEEEAAGPAEHFRTEFARREHHPAGEPSRGVDPRVDSYGERDLADDEISEQSAGGTRESIVSDGGIGAERWAQIRKNAAERRAAEEQQGKESIPHRGSQGARTDRTDEGETSGEETIESRVARIRARVAQLTSAQNDESGNPAAAR